LIQSRIKSQPDNYGSSRVYLGLVYEQKRMLSEALLEFDRVLQRYPENSTATTARAHTLARLKRTGEAQRILATVTSKPDPKPFQVCEVAIENAALGDADEAFRWLDKIAGIAVRM
jgi:predicted Zn-dependent protease